MAAAKPPARARARTPRQIGQAGQELPPGSYTAYDMHSYDQGYADYQAGQPQPGQTGKTSQAGKAAVPTSTAVPVDPPPAGPAAPAAAAEPAPDPPSRREVAADSARSAAAGATSRQASNWLSKPIGGGDGTGLLLGLIAYSIALNFIRFGTAGVTGWLSAKFLNKPMQGDW